jgi:hypothetical protein
MTLHIRPTWQADAADRGCFWRTLRNRGKRLVVSLTTKHLYLQSTEPFARDEPTPRAATVAPT